MRESLLASLKLPHHSLFVGQLYRDFRSHFVFDKYDLAYASQLEKMGLAIRRSLAQDGRTHLLTAG